MKKFNYTLLINYLIVIYALILPLSAQGARWIAISMIFLWILEGNWKEKVFILKKEHLLKVLILFVAVLSLSLLWTENENIQIGIRYISRFWYLLPLYVIYTSLENKMISHVLSSFLAGMLISEIVSYGIFFELIHIAKKSPVNPAPFMHHTIYSVFLVTALGILLNKLLSACSGWYKFLGGLFFLTMTANLFINAGRTGQVLFLFIVTYVIVNNYKFNIKSIVFISFFVLVIPVIAFLYSPNFHNRVLEGYSDLTQLNNHNTSLGARAGLYIVSKDIIKGHPILGVGVGDYLLEKKIIVQQKLKQWNYLERLNHYHNQYIEFWVISGIIGLILYILIWIIFAFIPIHNQVIHQIKVIIFISFTLTSLIDQTFHTYQSLSLFALFSGVILATKRIEQFNAKIGNYEND